LHQGGEAFYYRIERVCGQARAPALLAPWRLCGTAVALRALAG